MPTSFPSLVSLGEPMIEFNRPRDGDGRTTMGCKGSAATRPAPRSRQRRAHRSVTSPASAEDWMGEAFLALWRAEGVDATQYVRRPSKRATGVTSSPR